MNPSPPLPGLPVTATIGPAATLGPALDVLRTGQRAAIPDRPGVRTILVSFPAGALPAAPTVAAAPGSFGTLGDADRTTLLDGGLVRRGQDVGLASPQGAQLAWLLGQARALIAAAADPANEAAAIQVASWRITRAPGLADPPTSNDAVNARAAQLMATAPGRAAADRLVLAPPAQACLDVAVPVRVTGGPAGATVALTASGPGVLGGSSIVLDGGGAGSVTIRATRQGPIEVVATTTAPSPIRIATSAPDGSPDSLSRRAQGRADRLELLSIEQLEISGRTVVAGLDCPAADDSAVLGTGTRRPGAGPATPGTGARRGTTRSGVDTAPRTGQLPRVVVTGARVLVSGGSRILRVLVRNTSRSRVSGVSVATIPPRGTTVRSVRGGSGSGGLITWRVKQLKPGASVTLMATLTGSPTEDVDADDVIVSGASPVAAWERPLATPLPRP